MWSCIFKLLTQNIWTMLIDSLARLLIIWTSTLDTIYRGLVFLVLEYACQGKMYFNHWKQIIQMLCFTWARFRTELKAKCWQNGLLSWVLKLKLKYIGTIKKSDAAWLLEKKFTGSVTKLMCWRCIEPADNSNATISIFCMKYNTEFYFWW